MEQENNVEHLEDKMSLGEMPENFAAANVDGPVVPVEKPKTRIFIILGLLVVLALTLATILIVLSYNPSTKVVETPVVEQTSSKAEVQNTVPDKQTAELGTQSTSTELDAIQKDLDATSLDGLDQDLDGLENLLQ